MFCSCRTWYVPHHGQLLSGMVVPRKSCRSQAVLVAKKNKPDIHPAGELLQDATSHPAARADANLRTALCNELRSVRQSG
mmetsp:Transcript_21235/g.35401  ORF Transcript_21235/g.35401 Transcript_21235/m.35401 type:complete len:80 (-) Transcript_21235:165-404(-)